MMEELIAKLVELVESASPELWEIAQRQVLANIVTKVIWAVVPLIIFVVLLFLARICWRQSKEDKYNEDEWISGAIVLVVVSIGFMVFALTKINYIISAMINPKYYAIKALLDLIPLCEG
jgi:hypothetical protein